LEVVELDGPGLGSGDEDLVVPADVERPNSFDLESLDDVQGCAFEHVKDNHLAIVIAGREMVA